MRLVITLLMDETTTRCSRAEVKGAVLARQEADFLHWYSCLL